MSVKACDLSNDSIEAWHQMKESAEAQITPEVHKLHFRFVIQATTALRRDTTSIKARQQDFPKEHRLHMRPVLQATTALRHGTNSIKVRHQVLPEEHRL